jgi:hypothetical protein
VVGEERTWLGVTRRGGVCRRAPTPRGMGGHHAIWELCGKPPGGMHGLLCTTAPCSRLPRHALPGHRATRGLGRTCIGNVGGAWLAVDGDFSEGVDVAARGALRQRLAGEPCTARLSTCQHYVGGLLFAGHAHAHGCHDQSHGGLLQEGCTGRLMQTADAHQHTARSTRWPRLCAALDP